MVKCAVRPAVTLQLMTVTPDHILCDKERVSEFVVEAKKT